MSPGLQLLLHCEHRGLYVAQAFYGGCGRQLGQMGFLLLGGPGETKASVEESLSFADSLNLDSLILTLGIRIYPQTNLARQAVDEGLIAMDDPLLLPRFYFVEELRPWLRETVAQWAKGRSSCYC